MNTIVRLKGSSDPYSTPARRRRIIAEFSKHVLRKYCHQAAENVHWDRTHKRSATVIQTKYRQYMAVHRTKKIRYDRVTKAALVIECSWRKYSAIKTANNLRREKLEFIRNKLATMIYNIWYLRKERFARIAFIINTNIKRMKAAVMIQKTYRGYRGRLEFIHRLNRYKLYNLKLNQSATIIQACCRMRLAIKTFRIIQQRDFASRCIQRKWLLYQKKKLQHQQMQVIKIQRIWRGYECRMKLKPILTDELSIAVTPEPIIPYVPSPIQPLIQRMEIQIPIQTIDKSVETKDGCCHCDFDDLDSMMNWCQMNRVLRYVPELDCFLIGDTILHIMNIADQYWEDEPIAQFGEDGMYSNVRHLITENWWHSSEAIHPPSRQSSALKLVTTCPSDQCPSTSHLTTTIKKSSIDHSIEISFEIETKICPSFLDDSLAEAAEAVHGNPNFGQTYDMLPIILHVSIKLIQTASHQDILNRRNVISSEDIAGQVLEVDPFQTVAIQLRCPDIASLRQTIQYLFEDLLDDSIDRIGPSVMSSSIDPFPLWCNKLSDSMDYQSSFPIHVIFNTTNNSFHAMVEQIQSNYTVIEPLNPFNPISSSPLPPLPPVPSPKDQTHQTRSVVIHLQDCYRIVESVIEEPIPLLPAAELIEPVEEEVEPLISPVVYSSLSNTPRSVEVDFHEVVEPLPVYDYDKFATTIQMYYRKRYRKLFKAASIIQKVYRRSTMLTTWQALVSVVLELAHDAAMMVQCAYRCHLARQMKFQKKEEFESRHFRYFHNFLDDETENWKHFGFDNPYQSASAKSILQLPRNIVVDVDEEVPSFIEIHGLISSGLDLIHLPVPPSGCLIPGKDDLIQVDTVDIKPLSIEVLLKQMDGSMDRTRSVEDSIEESIGDIILPSLVDPLHEMSLMEMDGDSVWSDAVAIQLLPPFYRRYLSH